jgi:mycothiol synthase
MSLVIRPWTPAEHARVRTLAAHPSLQPEFELMLGEGFDRMAGDPFNRSELRRIATLDGSDAGFALTFLVPMAAGRFAATRIGVVEGARRRGVGSALLAESLAAVATLAPESRERVLSAYLPAESAGGFAARHGYTPTRRYWQMERPGREAPEPRWPAGVRPRVFEAGERDIARWVEVFNRSWSEHDHAVVATAESVRELISGGTIDPRTAFFAERDGRAVGFVRPALHATHGEIAVVGVVPEERRNGLGRALLRFGTRWLLDHGAGRVTLMVDGNNERALTLYRQESFEVVKTRQIWTRWEG